MLLHWKITRWAWPPARLRIVRLAACYAGAAVLIYADHLGKIVYS